MAAKDKRDKSAALPATDDERKKALEVALAGIEKQFGKGALMKLGAKGQLNDIQVIPTGCLVLDAALGVGGIPKGRIVEIFGPESSGKTTVRPCTSWPSAKSAAAVAAFIDAEHALDPAYAKKLGVDIDELYVSQPDTGEQALEICEALVRSGAIELVVVDSVAALVPSKAEIDGEMGDSFVGLQARLMSQALRKLTGVTNKTGATVIFINQLREKVGVMYGSPETHARRPRAQVLCLRAHRRAPRRADQERLGGAGQPHARQGGQEQGRPRPSARRSLTCSTARASPRRAACWTWPWSATSSTRAAHGSATRTSASARAARTRASSSRKTPTSPRRSTRSSARSSWPPRATKRPPRPTAMRPEAFDAFDEDA